MHGKGGKYRNNIQFYSTPQYSFDCLGLAKYLRIFVEANIKEYH